jgi:RNA polymerase sigma-70 factor, ECF subfamily
MQTYPREKQPYSSSAWPVQSTSDRELIHHCSDSPHSERAFRLLYDRYYYAVYRQATYLLKCPSLAEEATVDVFMKIWRNSRRLSPETNLKAYLIKATRNHCIDLLRQRQLAYASLEDCYALKAAEASPAEELERQELCQELQEAINELPPKGQTIFRLSREEGLKYSEIAELLGLSVKTVETHMRRSIHRLRQRFQAYAPPCVSP